MDIDKINEAYYQHLRLLKESDPLGRDPEDIDPNLDDDPDVDPEDEDAEGKIPAKYAYDLKRAQGEHPQAPITLQQTAQHLQMLELYLRTNVMAALIEGDKNEGKKGLNGLLQHILQPLIKAIQNTKQENEDNEETPSSDQQPAKKELTNQEWELQRQQNNNNKWAKRKQRWAEWKKNNPEKAQAHAMIKAKLNGKKDKWPF